MKMLKVSQCKKNLDFLPQSRWPESLPAFAWGDELLCGFTGPAGLFVVDLSSDQTSLRQAFCDVHKSLSLPELARLSCSSQSVLEISDLEFIFEKNGLRFSESLTDLFQKLVLAPLSFQNWAGDRKLGAKELFVLKSVEHLAEIEPLLLALVEKNPTRQVGIQILEKAVELFLMSSAIQHLLPLTSESCENWSLRIDQLRHPILTSNMNQQQQRLSQLSWPKFISAKVVQNQASLVNEVRLHYRNIGELKRNIDALTRIQSEIEIQNGQTQ